MPTNASEKFQMVKIITYSPCVLIYWPVRINLDGSEEIFSLPRILGIESSFLAVAVSFPVSKHRRGAQYNGRPETPPAQEKKSTVGTLFSTEPNKKWKGGYGWIDIPLFSIIRLYWQNLLTLTNDIDLYWYLELCYN